VVPDELALDTVSEAFQALSTDYRLSLPYIARVVVLEGRREAVGGPVSTVAARSDFLADVLSEAAP
jgi:Pvc16 N-terminal domain